MSMAFDLPQVELQVSRVRVEGLKKTKRDIVVEQIKDVLDVQSLSDLVVRSHEASERLRQMNVFKYVEIVWDTVKSPGGHGAAEGGLVVPEETVQVTFMVKESGRVKSTVGVEAGTQSGGGSISMSLRNLFGRAEHLEMTSSTSFPHWGNAVQLQFTKPYYKDLAKRLVLSLGTTDNKIPFSGYQEYVTGSKAALLFPSRLGDHTLSLEYDCRHLHSFAHSVPMVIREEAGHSMKCSIKHVLEIDKRDNPLHPTSGSCVKTTNEVAGIGGNVHFSKLDINSQLYLPIYRDWVLSLSLWGGYLHSFTPSKINDRFLLGGPSTLRGFSMWGAGPRENGFSLGGEAYWATGLHLYTPLPLVSSTGLFQRIRLHGYATAGNIVKKTDAFFFSTLRSLASNNRVSCGVGLHAKLGVAQLELNYVIPIKAHPNDQVNPGLQFGIGVDML